MSSVYILTIWIIISTNAFCEASHGNRSCSHLEIPLYELFPRILLGLLLVVIIVLATATNGFILAVVLWQKKFRTAVNSFIASQCCADLALALIVLPISLYGIAASDHDPMSMMLCRIQYYFNRLFMFMTAINLMVISLDRYVVIVRPDMKLRMSGRNTLLLIIALWTIVAVCNVPWELIASNRLNTVCLTSRHYYCIISYEGLGRAETIYAVVRILIFGVIPFLLMFYCFFKIFRAVRTSRRRVGPTIIGDWRKIAVKVYARSAITTVLVMGSFLVCILPLLLITIVAMANPNISSCLALAAKWLSWSDTAIKPMIYLIRSRKYSLELRQFVWKHLRLHSKISRESLKKYATPTKDLAARMSSYAIEVTSPVHFPTEREFSMLFTVQKQRQDLTAWSGGETF